MKNFFVPLVLFYILFLLCFVLFISLCGRRFFFNKNSTFFLLHCTSLCLMWFIVLGVLVWIDILTCGPKPKCVDFVSYRKPFLQTPYSPNFEGYDSPKTERERKKNFVLKKPNAHKQTKLIPILSNFVPTRLREVETILWLRDLNNDRQHLCCKTYWKRSSKVTYWLENVFTTNTIHRPNTVTTTTNTAEHHFRSIFGIFFFCTHLILRLCKIQMLHQQNKTNWTVHRIFFFCRWDLVDCESVPPENKKKTLSHTRRTLIQRWILDTVLKWWVHGLRREKWCLFGLYKQKKYKSISIKILKYAKHF